MGDEEITQINLGTYQVGIIGLKEALAKIASSQRNASDQELADALIRRLSKKNYIP
jgi:predicted HTH domain antitoxin